MLRLMKLLVFVSCLYSFSLCSEIIEIKNMRELIPYLKPETLVIFDLDNTLLEPAQELGNDQWFRQQLKKYEASGVKKEIALRKVLNEWSAIQHLTEVKLVEPGSDALVRNLQQKGFVVVGLTTRALEVASRTIEQLQSIGIDLSVTAPTKQEIFFMNGLGVLFRQGVLFTADTHKGNALEKFLAATHYKPKAIVFINDKASHLEPCEEFCQRAQIPFIGLRYGYLDEKLKCFRPDIAEIQFEKFGSI